MERSFNLNQLINVINKDNANNIQSKLIVEAGNGPVTADADNILQKRGIAVLPDFYANAGGVIVSYFEWVKNLSKMRYGLMQQREEVKRQSNLVSALEAMTDQDFPNDLNRSTLRSASFWLMPISLHRSLEDFLRITSTKTLVRVAKIGFDFFEVVGGVSKSKVLAGDITVII